MCEQQRCRSACASAQSDQHLCCSLLRYYMFTCFIQSFKILASFCSWAGWFESYLVENLWRHIFAWCGSYAHMLIHNGCKLPQYAPSMWQLWDTSDKPHCCETCAKSFRDKTTLTRYMLIHTGDKYYMGKTCGKLFGDKKHTNQAYVSHWR